MKKIFNEVEGNIMMGLKLGNKLCNWKKISLENFVRKNTRRAADISNVEDSY